MTRVDFYHLQKWPLETALPALLDKASAAGHRVVVLAASPERVEALTALLWTYDADSWLPHGSVVDGHPDLQPIWLTTADENPNRADLLVLTDGMDSARKAEYARCLDLFDGMDDAALAAARDRWRACRDAGFDLYYWQQNDRGGWERKR